MSVAVKAVVEATAEAVETDVVVVVDGGVHTTAAAAGVVAARVVADATVAVTVGMEGSGEVMANAVRTTTRTRVDPTHN